MGRARIDLQYVAPGVIGRLPVLARLGDPLQCPPRAEMTWFKLQSLPNVAHGTRRISRPEPRDPALMPSLRQRRIEDDGVAENRDGLARRVGIAFAQSTAHEQRH